MSKKFQNQTQAEKQQKLVNRILEKLDQKIVPWMKPWRYGRICCNYVSGRDYNGINRLILDEGEYVTFLQLKQLGGRLNKDFTSYTIYVPVPYEKEVEVVVVNDDGIEETRKEKRQYIRFNLRAVFPISDTNLPPKRKTFEPSEWESDKALDEFIQKSCERLGIKYVLKRQDRAYYKPTEHTVYVPEKGQFYNKNGYYATILHEIGHATGHPSLLNRDMSGTFGSKSYAKEELVAEIFAYSLLYEFGLQCEKEEDQMISYIDGWRKQISEDPEIIIHAASLAEKAMLLFMGEEYLEKIKKINENAKAS